RGIFPGFGIRTYFEEVLQKFLKTRGVNKKGGELTFEEFYKCNGNIDLRISGTNVSRKRSLYFSKDLTPRLPVAEAVAISMNVPVLFKPVLSEVFVNTTDYSNDEDPLLGSLVRY